MSKYLKLAIAAFLMLVSLAPAASARPRVIVRGFFGPAFYGPAWFGPGWVEPYGYPVAPAVGTVQFDTKMKDPTVYVDGGYAGTLGQLHSFHLRPGTHNIELRDRTGQPFFQQQISVIAGKTIKLTP